MQTIRKRKRSENSTDRSLKKGNFPTAELRLHAKESQLESLLRDDYEQASSYCIDSATGLLSVLVAVIMEYHQPLSFFLSCRIHFRTILQSERYRGLTSSMRECFEEMVVESSWFQEIDFIEKWQEQFKSLMGTSDTDPSWHAAINEIDESSAYEFSEGSPLRILSYHLAMCELILIDWPTGSSSYLDFILAGKFHEEKEAKILQAKAKASTVLDFDYYRTMLGSHLVELSVWMDTWGHGLRNHSYLFPFVFLGAAKVGPGALKVVSVYFRELDEMVIEPSGIYLSSNFDEDKLARELLSL
jgi:hypothetical protein